MLLAILLSLASLPTWAQTNPISVTELDSAASDWPKSVTAKTNIAVHAESGVPVITNGAALPVLSVSNALISTVYQGTTNQIPALATDIIEQINDLRRHRLIVGKEQYDNYRLVPYTPVEVKIFHRTGIAVIPIAGLPADLQKQLNYSPDKATEWLEAQQRELAEREVARAEQQIARTKAWVKEHTYSVKYLQAAFNNVPYGTEIVTSGFYDSSMTADPLIKNASGFSIRDNEGNSFGAVCVTDGPVFNVLMNAKRGRKFLLFGSKERHSDVGYFVVNDVLQSDEEH
jgi:hypothetical protein